MKTGTPVAVAVPGTPVALAASEKIVRKLIIQGYKSTGAANAGNVTVGDSTVVLASKPGTILTPGATMTLDIDGYPQDLAKIYIDGAAGDGAIFNYVEY